MNNFNEKSYILLIEVPKGKVITYKGIQIKDNEIDLKRFLHKF